MYSVVLMMALSSGPVTPAFGHRCNGCNGCSASHGCHVSACHGCHGCHGGRLFGKHCHGCHGGYGCHCATVVCSGCSGCNGTSCANCPPLGPPPITPPPPPPSDGKKITDGEGGTKKITDGPGGPTKKITDGESKKITDGEANAAPAPATIIVSLPADAKLKFDETVTESTSALRVFTSPALEPGKTYSYTLTAEIVRDGQLRSVREEVTVRAGAETRVTLSFPLASVAQN